MINLLFWATMVLSIAGVFALVTERHLVGYVLAGCASVTCFGLFVVLVNEPVGVV